MPDCFPFVRDGITYYFIDNEYYFGGDRVYGYMEGEAEKYAFFFAGGAGAFTPYGL